MVVQEALQLKDLLRMDRKSIDLSVHFEEIDWFKILLTVFNPWNQIPKSVKDRKNKNPNEEFVGTENTGFPFTEDQCMEEAQNHIQSH